jgi:glycosyltransferase involved in cell wall biosynthesis
MTTPKVTCVITTHNEGNSSWIEDEQRYSDDLATKHEGNEVRATIESLRENTRGDLAIVVVDDGSTDGSTDGLADDGVILVQHPQRIGIAYSRNEGVAAAPPDTDALVFLDAHQRISPGCVDQCARVALQYEAIVWPDVYGIEKRNWTGHGAYANLLDDKEKGGKERKRGAGQFAAAYRNQKPRDSVSRISAMVVPGYVMPVSVFHKVRPMTTLRGWGCSEPAMWVQAFFQDIDILHVCEGPEGQCLAQHLFRKKPHYSLPWREVYQNHAIVAKTLFDAATWEAHWFPRVFDSKHLDEKARAILDSPELTEEHLEFQTRKVRPDSEFWRGLLLREVPHASIE